MNQAQIKAQINYINWIMPESMPDYVHLIHYVLTLYQNTNFLEMFHLIQSKPGFHYDMKVEAHEYRCQVAPSWRISWEFCNRYNLWPPCIKFESSRKVSIWCKNKVWAWFFVGCTILANEAFYILNMGMIPVNPAFYILNMGNNLVQLSI